MAAVEEKVVKLSMDEKELDKGTKKAINDLDDLKKALLFEDAGKGLEAVSKAAAKVDMEPLSQGIAGITNQFNILNTAGAAAIFNITNRAIDAGERLVKALSVDQINAGWDKYADKTSAVQTIMAATSNQFEDTGKQMEYVESQLEKLNWFTDETSYRFLDMVNNIGKFTSNNIALEDSVDAMQGIANWAARSGAGVEGASRAMFNLSQAIGMGSVRLEDWGSIETANMSTYEFKETALDTAVALGILTKEAEGLYKTLEGKEITITGFREGLQQGWFTSDVLINTLKNYGNFASELNKFYEELEGVVPTTTLIGFIDDFIDGSFDMNEAMRLTGKDAEWLGERIAKLASDEYKLGRESFKAAQETKTFQEAIDYVKEAVSTGWMKTFELLFGNYEEAKEFFSSMSEWLYDIFVASGDTRNALLKLWKDDGGRDIFIDGLYQVMDNISTILETVKKAWHSVFPEATVDTIWSITNAFRNFVDVLTPTPAMLNLIKSMVTALATGLQTLGRMVRTAMRGINPFLQVLNRLAGIVSAVLSEIAKLSVRLMELIFPVDKMNEFGDSIEGTAISITTILHTALDGLITVLDSVFGALDVFITYLEQNGLSVTNVIYGLGYAFDYLMQSLFSVENVGGFFQSIFGGAIGIIEKVVEAIKSFVSNVTGLDLSGETDLKGWLSGIDTMLDGANIPGKLSAIIIGIGNLIGQMLTFVAVMFNVESDIHGVLTDITNTFSQLFQYIVDMISNLTLEDIKNVALVVFLGQLVFEFKKLFKALSGAAGGITKLFTTLNDVFKKGDDASFVKQMESIFAKTKWLQITLAIGILVSGLIQLASVPTDDLAKGVIAIIAVLASVLVLMKMIQKISESAKSKGDKDPMADFAKTMTALGIGIGAIGIAVAQIAKQNIPEIIAAVVGIGAVMAALYVFADKMQNIDTSGLMKAAGAAALIGVAIMTLIPTIAVFTGLAALNWKALVAAVGSVAVLMVAIGGFGKLMEKVNWRTALSAVPVVITLSSAILMLTGAVKTLSNIFGKDNGKSLLAGLGSLTAVIIEFTGAMAVLMALANDNDQLENLSKTMQAFALVVGVLAGSLKLLSTIPIDNLSASTKSLAIVIGVFAAALAGLIFVASKCQPAIPVLTAVAAVLTSLGIAAAGIGVAAISMSAGMYLLVEAFENFIKIGETFGERIPEYVTNVMDGVRVAIYELLKIIAGSYGLMILAAGAFFSAIVDALILVIPDVINGVMVLVIETCNAISKLIDPFVEAIVTLIDGITRNMEPIVQALWEFLKELVRVAVDLLVQLLYESFQPILEPFQQLFNGIYRLVKEGTFEGFATGVYDAAQDSQEQNNKVVEESAKETGEKYPEGFSSGVATDPPEDIVNRAMAAVNEGSEFRQKTNYQNGLNEALSYISGWDTGASKFDPGGLFNLFGGNTYNSAPKDPNRELSPWEEYEAMDRANEEAKAKAKETGYDIGLSYADGLGESIASSKAPSAGARSQAQKINDAFKDELEKLDTADKTAEALLKLWKAQNPNATDADIAVKEMELLAGQIETQSARAQISQMQYTETLQKMGESASETHEAYLKMIEDQTKLLELQNEMNQNQLQGHEATAEAFQRMNDIMHDYYYNENNGRTMAEYLKSLGFTDREIAEAAAKEAGYAIPKIVEETKDATVEATMNAGEQTVQLYAESVTTNLEGLTSTFTGFGNTYATSLGTGMTDMTDNVGTAAVTMVDTARDQASSEEMIEKWTDVGYQFDMGIIKGLERGEGEIYAAVERIIRAALAKARMTAGVASPSKETMYQASMWVAGYVKGLNDNGADVTKAITKPITAAMNASENIFANSSTEGFNKSFLNGMNQSASMLAQKVHNLGEVTADEMDKFKNEVDLKGLFDGLLDEDEIHVQVVLDLDDTAVQGLSARNLPMTAYPNPIDQNSLAMLSQQIQNESNRISAIEARMNLEKSSGGDSGSQMENQAQAPVINMTQNNYSPKALTRLEIRRDTERMVTTMANRLNVPRKR